MDALNKRLNVNLDNFTVVNNAIDTAVFDKILLENKNELLLYRTYPNKKEFHFKKNKKKLII